MTELDREQMVDRITTSARVLRRPGGLLDRLRNNLAEPVSNGPSEVKTKGFESRVPWNGEVAAAYFVIVAETVELEAWLRRRLGERADPRPKTHHGALNALVHIPCLAAEQTDDRYVAEAFKRLRAWVRMARACPGVDGSPKLTHLTAPCPFCLTASLVVPSDLSGDVVCQNLDCLDPRTGKPPRWRRGDWADLLNRTLR